jgi:hypothetical protein
MAKLYWRVKKNGKWTWKPATCMFDLSPDGKELWLVPADDYQEGEEE